MGRPKQLLRVGGQSLLTRAARAAVESSCSKVIVVLGAAAAEVRPEIAHLPVKVVVNDEWSTGIASSIRAGLAVVDGDSSAVLFAACDQPAMTPSVLDGLIGLFRSGTKGIAASEYAGTLGIPALFSRWYFGELAKLAGDSGARKIIAAHSGDVESRPFPGGAMDVDTPEDFVPWSR
jgi:molybdenum cofactor cytidylyltransferase